MKWLNFSLQYLPTVLTTVVAVENATQAPGATKRQLVMNIITAGAKGAEAAPNATVQGIGQLIDIVVAELNTSGIFSSKAKA